MTETWKSITNWVPVVGIWDVSHGNAKYTEPQVEVKPYLSNMFPYGLCVSDATFAEGSVKVTVEPQPFPSGDDSEEISGRIVLGYKSPDRAYVVVGLGGYRFGFTISVFVPDKGWTGLALAGSEKILHPGTAYRLMVSVEGQRVKLYVNEAQLIEHVMSTPLPQGQIGLFAWGKRPVNFSDAQLLTKAPEVFVVMQFSDTYRDLYSDVIKPVTESFGLSAYHVGEVYGPGFILADIQRGISEASIVIADVTPQNQNVFYELGYAHALHKPTILLAERGKQLPFDVAGYRCLFYDNTIGGKKELEDNLKKNLTAILKP
ncbi:MAG: hypothetical protein WAU88_14365 [Candidatus Zixiibacteriota bacterium]